MNDSNSMAAAIIPKSDQLNSDDLIAGPITIKVTGVTIRGGQEQPVAISYEGDNGKPYKSCKSMNRVLVTCWGADAKQYVGRSMTLYREPTVKWGGMEVGGIRISHLSDIPESITMALTATKGSRKPFTVRPLKSSAPTVTPSAATPSAATVGADSVDWAKALSAAATLDDLSTVWLAVPKPLRADLASLKDARKAELQQPAADDFGADYDNERAAIER